MTALLTAVLAFGALAGCTSTQTGGNPTPAPTNGTGQTSSDPTSGESPSGLSIAKYLSKPCDTLKPDQVTTLGSVRAGVAGTNVLGPECTWRGQDPIKNSTYEVSVTENKDFDSRVEGVKTNGVFIDKKIDDVRVVSTDGTDGGMYCLTMIQVSKTDSVTVQIAGATDERATKKPCPETERVAQLIITNLRG
ncbi:DUF3558 domain-containing protein [Lentzea sp. NPDC051213]|uniref:DUF3558 domain-containing protein n=1 Tax=Lentzea sp. NPDC051213 TaxID=3364126 RepID=UPI0037906E4F